MIVQKQIDTFIMNLNLVDNGISAALYTHGAREKAFMSILNRTVQKGDVCIDLGANIGYTTLFMLRNVGSEGYVYAIEPDQHNIDMLRSNIVLNGFSNRCDIDKCVISDSVKETDFWIAKHPNLNSVKKTKHSIRKETIQAYSLTSYMEGKEYPNFIKMDVEGHEVKIFEGGLDYFTKNPGKTSFLVEVHPHFYDEENNFEAILEEYFKIGFNCDYVVSTPIPRPQLFKDNHYYPSEEILTDGFKRGVYKKIKNKHLLEFACRENIEGRSKKIVRSFMLTRDK